MIKKILIFAVALLLPVFAVAQEGDSHESEFLPGTELTAQSGELTGENPARRKAIRMNRNFCPARS